MSQNKTIAENNQNIIPNSGNTFSRNMTIKQKDQSLIDTSLESKNSDNGYEFNGNAGIQAAKQGTRNKR